METKNKLDFLLQMIQCCYDIGLTTFRPETILPGLNYTQDIPAHDDDFLIALNLARPLQNHIENGLREPLLISDELDLIWIAAFEYEDETLKYIHILGPSYSGRNSYQTIKKSLDKRNLSVSIRAKVFRFFDRVPIVPTSQLYQYALMLHYCISGEKIEQSELHFSGGQPKSAPAESDLTSKDHRGIWVAEQQFLNMFKNGDPDYEKAISYSHNLSSGPNFETESSLRKAKSTSIILLTLCSRASIEGGLSPAISYSLNDHYMQMIEDCTGIAEVTDTCSTFMQDYVTRVRREKNNFSMSATIKAACEFISIHIKEKISIKQLAEQAGYTEYYFSHKFKNEVGLTVSEYIKHEKIQHAKLLLCGTNLSIQEIAEELSFSSRSYFSQSFKSETGVYPNEYRIQNSHL